MAKGNKSGDTFPVGQVQFGKTPVWLFEAHVSSKAVHLYGWLSARYANVERRCWPSQDTLATDLQWTTRTVKRAVIELRSVGAIVTTRQHDGAGHLLGMSYYLPMDHPGKKSKVQSDTSVTQEQGLSDKSVQPRGQESHLSEPDPRTRSKESTNGDQKRRSHRRHIYCGERFCVPDFLHEQFEQQLGDSRDDFLLSGMDGFYATIDKESGDPIADDPINWLKKRFTTALRDLLG